MSRWLPSPFVSAAIVVVWLLLVGTTALGHVLLALALGVVLPMITERLRPERARMRSPATALRLALVVVWDIVLSNIEVARRVLGREANIRPGFVWIPLDIENPYGIATLAGIITMTPGTLSADLTPDRRHLLVHCFHLEDAAATVAQIKQRYEAPLRRIFP